MKKDYSNSLVTNNNGSEVQITNIMGYNSKKETLYGYICSKCGTESVGTIDKIKRNKGCKNCKSLQTSNSEKFTKEYVENILHENNPHIDIVGKYFGKSNYCLLKCNRHNLFFKKKPSAFLYHKSRVCPECLNEKKEPHNKIYNIDIVEKILFDLNYEWLNKDKYIDASTMLELKCMICGTISKSNITSIVNGRKCKRCSGYERKTTDIYKLEVQKLVGNEYSVIGDYVDNKTHIKMRHNSCGYEWDVAPTNFVCKDRRCPKCNISKGEQKIENYLINKEIKFFREHSFDDCIYKRKLRFDFYLPDYNVCIEFQRLQHYISVDYMGGDVDFQNRQIRDNIKKEYCKSNNIYLIEIPYNKIENINDILEKHLKKSSA